MNTWRTEQLGYCQAWTESGRVNSIGIRHYVFNTAAGTETADTWFEDCTIAMLRSYSSIVAIELDGFVFLLPRHDYSATTSRQVNRWLRERGYNGKSDCEEIRAFNINGIGWKRW